MKGVDLFVLLKVASMGQRRWTQNEIAYEIGLSPSQVNRALHALHGVRLYSFDSRCVSTKTLVKALVAGANIFLPARMGPEVRGIFTAWGAPPLSRETIQSSLFGLPVWPYAEGDARGFEIEPLHPNAPMAALRDPVMYELLALVDALRLGGSRETEIAGRLLAERLEALQK